MNRTQAKKSEKKIITYSFHFQLVWSVAKHASLASSIKKY